MMKPRLYEAGTLTFTNNGLGSLCDAKECYVKQAFGAMELEMKYPVSGRLFHALTYQRIILAQPEPMKDPQPFYIYRINAPMGGVVTVYAKHVCYKLDGCPVRPFTASTATEAMRKLKENAMTEHPFSFETDVERNGSFEVKKPTATWSILGGQEGSVLDIFHGEYEFDQYTVRLLTRRGMDRGVSLRYGKNLQTLEQDANCAGCYTGVVPYWVNSQSGAAVYAEPVLAEGNFGYSRVLPVDFTDKFESKPSTAKLQEEARQYIKDNDIGVPNVSLKVKFVQLEQTEELSHLALLTRVQFGDTVLVYFPELNIDVSSRIVETVYDCLKGWYKEVTIGKVKYSLADMIVGQQKQIEKIPQGTAFQIAMAQATAAILGAKGGAVRMFDTDGDGQPDTLYVADDADPAKAVYVWRWNWAGWACSKSGYEGPFTMAATIDGGFVADFITTGNLNASLLTTGTLNAQMVKVINLSADNITTGKLNVNRLDVDNLVVKALKAQERASDGFIGIVETDNGKIRMYANDGSVVRQVMNIGTEHSSSNFATCNALINMDNFIQGRKNARLNLGPGSLIMASEAAYYGQVGSFHVHIDANTGLFNVNMDELTPTQNGDMKWEYISAIGKTVLVKK